MIVALRFYHFIMASSPVYLYNPDGLDVVELWESFKAWVNLEPEPNVFSYGDHREWLLAKARRLQECREKYKCDGDFDSVFVEHLIQEYGFKRVEVSQIQL